MATALQSQLNQIAANSTNPLDLKAQRKAHSQSILYGAADAARQDFDTLYDECSKGFRDLSGLDRRFTPYARTLFAEQSKEQDRTQLTAAQNRELDSVIESFLSLVASRLHLRPALLTLEWLVRRFRIHHYNTAAILFTFLPYHTLPHSHYTSRAFSALLSILPQKLPDAFRFLEQPKKSSSAVTPLPLPPSGHTIVAVATQNPAFFAAFNAHTIATCRRGHEYDILAAVWVRVVSEALAGRIDRAGSRKEARQAEEEDVTRQVLSILNDLLSLRRTGDMRVACYTVLAVLVSKVQLADRTLDLLMEAVCQTARSIDETELVCLAVLSQQRQADELPQRVCKALMLDADIGPRLVQLGLKFEVERLALGLVLYVCATQSTETGTHFINEILSAAILRDEGLATAVQVVIRFLKTSDVTEQEAITQALRTISLSDDTADGIKEVLQKAGYGEATDNVAGLLEDAEAGSGNEEMEVDSDSKFDTALSQVAKLTVDSNPATFLTGQVSATYELLAQAAQLAAGSQTAWTQLSQLKCFQARSKEILYVSFLLRFCSGPRPSSARNSAYKQLATFIRENDGTDFQHFLPFVLCGLGDSSQIIRRAATTILVSLQDIKQRATGSPSVFGNESLYGQKVQTLSSQESSLLLQTLVQSIEEYRLDASRVSKVLENLLSPKTKNTKDSNLKNADREAILSFLASAIESSPILAIRVRLLDLTAGVSKVGSTSKSKALVAFIRQEVEQTESLKARLICESPVTPELELDYWTHLFNALSIGSSDGMKLIKEVIINEKFSLALRQAALIRAKLIWPSERPEKQLELASGLFEVTRALSSSATATLAATAAETLRAVKLSEQSLVALLDMLPALSDIASDGTSSTKRRRTSKGHVDGSSQDVTTSLQQWTFVLELVQISRHRENPALLKKMNQVLVDFHAASASLPGQAHYVEAMILDALNAVITDVAADNSHQPKAAAISVDIIVDIFQTSSNAQVQRSALILISTLAKVFPDPIMHHIMPLFTSMSQSVLQNADDFSIHVADLAIKSIIPPLLQSFRKQKSGMQEGMVRVLLSFVVSYEHISESRRLPVFTSLTQQLGPEDSLHLLILLFVDKHGRGKGAEDLIVELVKRHEAATQLLALKNAIRIIDDTLQEQPQSLTSQIIPSKDRKVRFATGLQFLLTARRIMQDPELQRNVEIVLSKDDKKSQSVRSLYSDIIEGTLRISTTVQTQKKLAAASAQLLDSALKLLPIHDTIHGLGPLLESQDITIRRLALKSLEDRVGSVRTKDIAAQDACLDLLTNLRVLLQDTTDAKLSQSIISCTDSIIERFGKKSPEETILILQVVASAHCLSPSSSDQVKIMALFCLATAVQTLGEACAMILPRALQLSFAIGETCIDSEGNATLFNAMLAFFSAILDNASWAFEKRHVHQLLLLSAKAAGVDDFSEDSAEDRASALALLAKRAEPQVCIAGLNATWSDATDSGTDAMIQHVHVLETVISVISKSTTAKVSQNLLGMVLNVLGTGASGKYSAEELEPVEDLTASVMVQMVYKLNDTHFRPLFIRLLDWTSEPKDRAHLVARHAAAYKFLYRFFDTLKSIVTSYTGLILDDVMTMLENDPSNGLYDHTLWVRIMQTLTAALEHDQDEFIQAPSRFEKLCAPLTSQLARASALKDATTDHLVPCIVAFASAADSSENQKAINSAVLAHLRSDDEAVRLAAVRCQRQLTEALSDEWLAHLPEMLPFVSEALEDDDEEVQNETRAWVARIEAIIGESLGPMLQ